MTPEECAEEQAMEIEALSSILMDDMRALPEDSGDGIAHASTACWCIEISAYGDNDTIPDDDEGGDDAVLGLVFAHSAGYPEEAPLVKCRSVRGLRDGELLEIQSRVHEQCENSLGQAMIFDLVQTCKEWMRARVGASDACDEETEDELKARLEAEAEERLRQMRLVGTPVTEESFKSWERSFMREMRIVLPTDDDANDANADGRMTGKRYFATRTAAHDDDSDGDGDDEEFIQSDGDGESFSGASTTDDEDDDDDDDETA